MNTKNIVRNTKVAMAKKKEILNVFLDTQVFDQYRHDYSGVILKKFRSLAMGGYIRIFLTTITQNEIYSHIETKTAETHQKVLKLGDECRIPKDLKCFPLIGLMSKTMPDEMKKELQGAFEAFCTDAKVEVLSVNDVKAEDVFLRYFKRKPPFGDGKKKEEFPDAFSGEALRLWCEKNKATMRIVTDDEDWNGICEQDKCLIYMSSAKEFLALLPDPDLVAALKTSVTKHWEKDIEPAIIEKFTGLGFYLSDVEGEVYEVEVNDKIELDTTYVISAQDGKAIVEVDCEIPYKAEVEYEVPGTGHYDKEDGRILYAEQGSGEVEDSEYMTAHITLAYEKEKPSKITVEKVEFPNRLDIVGVDPSSLPGCESF